MCIFSKEIIGENVCAPNSENEIMIMSFNIRNKTKDDKGIFSWETRAPFVLKNIAKVQPDVIGFQEARPVQFAFLKKYLSGYDYVLVYRDKKGKNSEACPIFYNKSRFSLLKGGAFWLTDTPDVMSKPKGMPHERICTYALLKDKSGAEFAIYNAHPDYDGDALVIKEIKIVCDRVAQDGYKSIVIGDLNTGKAHPALAPLNEGFDDALVPFGLAGKVTFTAYNKPNTTEYHDLDHIYLPKGTEVLSAGIVDDIYDGVFPSDHYPIYAKINLSK